MFVRQDLPLEHQIVQSNHASLTLASLIEIGGIPNIILIGVPNQAGLLRVHERLAANAIGHYMWEEPDYEMGLTAIATHPLDLEQKKVLSQYRLWRPISACSSEKERPSTLSVDGGSVVQVSPGAPCPRVA